MIRERLGRRGASWRWPGVRGFIVQGFRPEEGRPAQTKKPRLSGVSSPLIAERIVFCGALLTIQKPRKPLVPKVGLEPTRF